MEKITQKNTYVAITMLVLAVGVAGNTALYLQNVLAQNDDVCEGECEFPVDIIVAKPTLTSNGSRALEVGLNGTLYIPPQAFERIVNSTG
jgi:hypothetical protein